MPPPRFHARGHPAGAVEHADGQVGAGAAEADSVEAALVELGRPLLEHGDVVGPGRRRVALVEAHGRAHGVPQAGEIRLAEDLLGPLRRREADDRPRHLPAVEGVPVRAPELRHHRLRHPLGVDPREQVRIRLADDVDERGPALRLLAHPLEQPARSPRDRLLGRQRRSRPPKVNVEIVSVDPAGALPVGDLGDRADERRVLDVGAHGDVLTLLEVDAHPEDEPGVLLELVPPLVPERCRVHSAGR